MKKNLLLSAIIFQSLFAVAQRYEWINYSTQGNSNSNSNPVAVDPAGNVYALIVTNASGAVIGTDTFPTLVPGNGGVLVAKFSPAGNLIWGKMISTTGGGVAGEKVVADNAGSVYASCYFGNSGEVHMSDTIFQPSFQGVIIKLDSSSNFVRAWVAPTGETARMSCLGTDVYISYEGTVEKLDSAFNTIWSKSGPAGNLSFLRGDIFVQTNGELIVSASEGFNSVGDILFGTDTIHFTFGNFDEVAVIKMDTTGQVLWTKTLPVLPHLRAVALDHTGNAYFGMGQMPPAQFIFANDTLNNAIGYCGILKWNAAGVPQWARGLYLIAGNGIVLYDFDVNAQEELLVSGSGGQFSFNNDTIIQSSPAQNTYLIKLNSSGTFQWHKGPTDIASFATYADGVAVRNGNEYIQAGSTNNAAILQFGCLPFSITVPGNFVTFISENPEAYPVASFTFLVSNDTTYTFTDASTNATSWHWDFGDGDTSNVQNPTHDFIGGGDYTVILTVHNGPCSSTDTLQLIGVGIDEIINAESFSLFPNPITTELRIESSKFKVQCIDVYDLVGEKIMQRSLQGENKAVLEMRTLPAGIYFVTVTDEKKNKVTKKFVKM